MKQLLIILSIVFLAASCPDCPTHDPTICDTVIFHDSTVITYKDTTIIHYTDTVYCDTLATDDILFQTDFTNDQFYGTGMNWALPDDFMYFNWTYATTQDKNWLEFITDSGNRYLKATIVDGDGVTGRIQGSFRMANDPQVLHYKMRIYLHPDIQYLETLPQAITAFSLFEFWETVHPGWDGNTAGQAHWFFSLYKPLGNGKLNFQFWGQKMQPASEQFKDLVHVYSTVPVRYGEWMTIENKITRGNPGHVRITIDDVVLFDLDCVTEYPNNALPVSYFQPFKFYMSDASWQPIVDYMRNAGKELSIKYDDLKIYK